MSVPHWRKALSILVDSVVILLVELNLFVFRLDLTDVPSVFPWIIAFPFALGAYLYLTHRLFGKSLGHWLTGYRRIDRRTHHRSTRVYDWLFESELRMQYVVPPGVTAFRALSLTLGMLVFGGGLTYSRLAQNRLLRGLRTETIPLFAPPANSPDWRTLPFFFASGAWPKRFDGQSLYFSVPYEKGPPDRFVGKIFLYFGTRENRVTLTGPLTIRSVSNRAAFEACLTRRLDCFSLRRELAERFFKPLLGRVQPTQIRLFRVDNPNLDESEQPFGLRFQAARGKTEIEGYFIANAKMATQGVFFESDDPKDTAFASEKFRQIVGSLRTSTDLTAPRTWVDQALASYQLRRQAVDDLLSAQQLLLSKISVDPVHFEPFYHLAGTSFLLFKGARAAGMSQLTAASQRTLEAAFHFAQDVGAPERASNPDVEKKIGEIETWSALAEKAR